MVSRHNYHSPVTSMQLPVTFFPQIPLFLAVSFFLLHFFQFSVTFFPVPFFPVSFCPVTFFPVSFFPIFFVTFFPVTFFPVTFFPVSFFTFLFFSCYFVSYYVNLKVTGVGAMCLISRGTSALFHKYWLWPACPFTSMGTDSLP